MNSGIFCRTFTPSGWRSFAVLVYAVILITDANAAYAQTSRMRAKSARPDSERLAEASKTFASTCAGCHGLDGRGGERGPNIASLQEVQRRSDEELLRIVRNGISETGMPNFAFLGSAKIEALVSYLRVLQGKSAAMPIPGDSKRGESLFFGKAQCSQCHAVNGKGGFIGSDLSVYAAGASPAEISRAIVNPDRDVKQSRGKVSVTFLDGRSLEGVVRNEDNFSLQLQSLDGAFHLIQKAEVGLVKPSAQPLMPEDYGKTLSPAELDDIVGYLMRIAQKAPDQASTKQKRDHD
jgi:putative heme-binding domain-containing protein